MTKFSVLISVYHNEKAESFNRAMQSIWDEQNVKPSQIVLVQDGKLTEELYEIIKQWKKKLGSTLKCVPLERNMGLGDALRIGLDKCDFELVARMDADDIALPNRFSKQLEIFDTKNVDVCGSWVSEFEDDENKIISYKKVPECHESIIKYAKLRCPVNHPSAMFKKSVVEDAGGYKKMIWFEDYYLWVRLILNGARFYNVQQPLVKMRAGYGQLERRRGYSYLKAEMVFLTTVRNLGFLSNFEFVRNLLVRLSVRVMPKHLLKYIYKKIRVL